MPSLDAVTLPAYGWVRLTSYWEDAKHTAVTIYRVDSATGVKTPIRPHTWYDGWSQSLSGGLATVYDTEAPLDRPFYYQQESTADPGTLYTGRWRLDLFERTVAAGNWGTADTGEVWSMALLPSDHSVSGGTGRQSNGTINSLREALLDVGDRDQRLTADVKVPVVPTGAGITLWQLGRVTDASNYYAAQLAIGVGGAATLIVAKRVAGTLSTLGSVGVGTHAANNVWRIVLDVQGYTIRAKAWNTTTSSEPATWTTVLDGSLATGNLAGLASRLETGNTNTLPVVVEWDRFYTSRLNTALPTDLVTLASQGGFWLRSPLHPAKDRRILLKPTPSCPPTAGKFFVGMDPTEQYAGNSATLAPVNRRLGAYMSRPRRGVDSTLTLVTRTFTDRDEVLDTASDGTALQFAAPPEYGIPLRYLGVGDVTVQRGMTDHRFQPRIVTLPHTEVAQPGGPATGVAGVRHKDLCSLGEGVATTLSLWDTYDRDVSNGWGTPAPTNPDGLPWTSGGGSASDYSVSLANSAGRMVAGVANSSRRMRKLVTKRNLGVKIAFLLSAVPTGASAELSALLRINPASESDTFFQARIEITTAGAIIPVLIRRIAGTTTTLATGATLGTTYTAALPLWLRAEQFHDRIRMKAWRAADPEPTAWGAFAIDAAGDAVRPDGHYGLRAITFPGNTNSPLNFDIQHYEAYDLGEYGPDADFQTWDSIAAVGYSYTDLISAI